MQVRLGDICNITSSKRIFASEYTETGIPFYRSKEIIEKNRGEAVSNPLYISFEKYELLKRKYGVPSKDDILLTSVGTIGIPYRVKDGDIFYFKDGNLTWLKDFSKSIDKVFLYYYISNPFFHCYLNHISLGSSQSALTIDKLNNIEISVPDKSIQEKIGQILSDYDELRDIHRRKIIVLEEMVIRIYREWFVHFRFPNHESCEFENGLPKGWNYLSITDVLEIRYGKDHKDIEDGEFPIYGSGGIMRKGNKYLYNGKSVLIPRKGTLNNIMLVDGSFWCIDTMFYSVPKICNISNLVYFQLNGYDMESLNSGTALPSMTTKILSGIKVIVPSKEIRRSFDDIVDPILTQISILKLANYQLEQMRDRLLPRLMSGNLDVSC